MDKTELMCTGTKYNVTKIPVCCHSLTLGGAPKSSDQTSRPYPSSSIDAGFVPWQTRHRGQCQKMLLLASTTAPHPTLSRRRQAAATLQSWSVRERRRPTCCSVFSMLRPESSPAHARYDRGLSHFRRREFSLHWQDADARVQFRTSECV